MRLKVLVFSLLRSVHIGYGSLKDVQGGGDRWDGYIGKIWSTSYEVIVHGGVAHLFFHLMILFDQDL
jgi:hypothetical protein